MMLPILREHLDGGPMIHRDHALQYGKELWSKARPALPQNQVVAVLNTDASDLLQQIKLIKQFL